MIKIEKDLAQVPASLQVPPMNRSARATHRIRERLVRQGQYPKKSSTIDKRYKMEDIKDALFKIYNGKCAFCEQRVERWHVEHFRPKSVYYWLAFSWDNLLYACPNCNGEKNNHFDINGQRVEHPPLDLTGINSISVTHDEVEQRRFINPEFEDPEPLLLFQKDGLVFSLDDNCRYTIEKCGIDRKYLNDNRKGVWDDFINDLKSEVVEGKTKQKIRSDVMVLVRKFRRDAELNPANEFLAFRRYAIKNFLRDTLKELLS